MHKYWCCLGEVSYCFSMSIVQFQGQSHGPKNRWFWPEFSVSGLYLQFESTDGFEMIHKALHGIDDVPYCLPRSCNKFQGYKGQKKSSILTRIGYFETVTVVWIHRWIWNNALSLTLYIYTKEVPCGFRGHPSNFKVTRLQNRRFVSISSKITRPIAAIKSLGFALFCVLLVPKSLDLQTVSCRSTNFWLKKYL